MTFGAGTKDPALLWFPQLPSSQAWICQRLNSINSNGTQGRLTQRDPTRSTRLGLPLRAPSAWKSLLRPIPSGPYHMLPTPRRLLVGLPRPPVTSSSFLAFPVTNTIFFPAKGAAMPAPDYPADPPEALCLEWQALPADAEAGSVASGLGSLIGCPRAPTECLSC